MNMVNNIDRKNQTLSSFVRELVQCSKDFPVGTYAFVRKPPQKIVQFWDNLERIPADVKECMATWRKLEFQGIEILLFDKLQAGNFIHQKLGVRYRLAYDKCYHPAMQSDYFRLCYIFAEGGCYIDADDVYTGAQIKHLFNDGRLKIQPLCHDSEKDIMVPSSLFAKPGANNESWIYYFNNNPLIAASGHPVIKRALDQATLSIEKNLNNGLPDIHSITGPGNITKSIVEISTEIDNIEQSLMVLSNWEDTAKSVWELSYRKDKRNWRLSNRQNFVGF